MFTGSAHAQEGEDIITQFGGNSVVPCEILCITKACEKKRCNAIKSPD